MPLKHMIIPHALLPSLAFAQRRPPSAVRVDVSILKTHNRKRVPKVKYGGPKAERKLLEDLLRNGIDTTTVCGRLPGRRIRRPKPEKAAKI